MDRREPFFAVAARRPLLRVIVVAAVVIAAVDLVRARQAQPAGQTPTFRVRTDLVQLDVSVLDEKGLPVRGLSAEDFTILEDGAPQPVAAFAAIDVPTWSAAPAAWTREVGPDVASNRLEARRAVVIVMDDFFPRWDPGVTKVAKSIAIAAIDELGPADLAAVVYVVNRRNGQEFTLDRGRLRAAVERFIPTGLTPASGDRFSASLPSGGLTVPSRMGPQTSGACMQNCVVMALNNIGEIFDSWPGARKTVVLISPAGLSSGVEALLSEGHDRSRMFAALQRANVNVYQFDPHGLQIGSPVSNDFAAFAENTGGRAVTNTNEPADFVPQMYRENSSYYLLGFRPASDKPDGRFHRIKVEVKRPGVQVRARAGYYAPLGRPPAPSKREASAVDRALSGGLPVGDLPLSLATVPFATASKPGAAVAVVARLDHAGESAPGTVVEFTAKAFDGDWKQVASATQTFMLPADDRARFAESAQRLNLPPGRYEIRAAMRSTVDDRVGSVYTSVVVQNFSREPLALSGLAVERQAGGAAMADDLAAVVPARMTTERQFTAGERVAVVARVYQGRAKQPLPVRMTARIVDIEDRAASTTEALLEPAGFSASRHADYRVDLPLDRLVGGEYLLIIEASAASTTVRRELRFAIRQ